MIKKARTRIRYKYDASGHWVQLMKSNTTPVFTMMELYKCSGDNRWRDSVRRWIQAASDVLVHSGHVHETYHPPSQLGPASLVSGFIMMDVLCDAWWSIERDPSYLKLAEEIAESCLAWRWENGVIPMTPTAERDHLDGQVDFSISLRRISQLANRDDLLKASTSLMERALDVHRTEDGFCTHVDFNGAPVRLAKNTVDPKYNGLVLKGLIHLSTLDKPLYGSPHLMDLFKDR